jgi:hypothetical protein
MGLLSDSNIANYFSQRKGKRVYVPENVTSGAVLSPPVIKASVSG